MTLFGALAMMFLGCAPDPDLVLLHLIVQPGFSGDLKVVEMPGATFANSHDVVLRQSGKRLIAPTGLLKRAKAWTVVELKDTSGKSLPVDMETPKGQLSYRGTFSNSDGWFLVVSEGR